MNKIPNPNEIFPNEYKTSCFIKKRFDDELIELLLELKWWDFDPDSLVEVLPMLCDTNLQKVRVQIKAMLR